MQAVRLTARRGSQLLPSAGRARNMSGAVSHEEEVKEMSKWKMITFLAIPLCGGLAAWDLSHGAHHEEERPAYPYLNIRTKTFPWGDCALFDTKCWAEQRAAKSEGGDE